MNGTFAICLFFVIPGFSLSIGYLQSGNDRFQTRMAAGRYLRLAFPILVICAVTYVLMVLNAIPGCAATQPIRYIRKLHADGAGFAQVLPFLGLCAPIDCRKLQSPVVDHVL